MQVQFFIEIIFIKLDRNLFTDIYTNNLSVL